MGIGFFYVVVGTLPAVSAQCNFVSDTAGRVPIVLNSHIATIFYMGKRYSTDLRERVLRAIEEGMIKTQAHGTFHISRSTIDHWFALRLQTGRLDPPLRRSSGARQLEGKEFEEFARRHKHETLGEMALAWQEEKGVSLSIMSFSRALGEIGWTHKKRVGATRSATKARARRGSRRSQK